MQYQSAMVYSLNSALAYEHTKNQFVHLLARRHYARKTMTKPRQSTQLLSIDISSFII